MRRLQRWLLRTLVAMVLLAVALAVAGQTGAVRILEHRAVVRFLEQATDAQVALGSVSGTLGHSLVLENLRLATGGRTVVRVPLLEIVYAPLSLLRGVLEVRRITIVAPRLRAIREAGGWRLFTIHRSGALPIAVGRLEVTDGRIAVALLDAEPRRRFAATALSLAARGHMELGGDEVEIEALRFVPRGVALPPVQLAGRLVAAGTGEPLRLRDVHLTTTRSRLDAEVDLAGARAIDARLTLAPLASADLRAIVPEAGVATDVRARLHARGPWEALALAANADLGSGGRFHARATLDATARPVPYTARLSFAGLDPGAVRPTLPRVQADGRLALRGDGRVHRLRGTVRTPAGEAALGGRLVPGSPPAYGLRARVVLPQLAALDARLAGSASGRVRVTGRGFDQADRHANARLALGGAVVGGVPFAHGAAHIVVDGPRVRVATARVSGPEVTARASGKSDLAHGTVDLTVAARADLTGLGRRLARPLAGRATLAASAHGPLTALDTRATLTAERPAYGTFDAARASADLAWRHAPDADKLRVGAHAVVDDGRAHAISATIERSPVRTTTRLEQATIALPGSSPWQLVAPATFVIEEGIRTDGVTLVAGPQRVTFAGRVGLRGTADARLGVEHLALTPVCTLAALPRCAGEVTARATLRGTAAAPIVDATAQAEGLAVEDVRYGVLSLDAQYADTRAIAHAVLIHPLAGEMSAQGSVPVDLAWAGARRDLANAPLDLTLRADHVDLTALGALAPQVVRRAAGFVTVDLRVTGTRATPRPVGSLSLEGAMLELAGTGVPYEDLRARIAADGTVLDVQELHARAGDGTLDGSGQLDVAPGGPLPLALTFRLDRFLAVRREAVEALASGTLTAGGSLGAPEVRGTLEIVHGALRPAGLPASPPTRAADPTIRVVGLEEAPPARAEPSPGLPDRLALGVTIRLAKDVSVRRSDANIALGGELEATKTPGDSARLTGEIRLLHGWFEFQGRRFEIKEGTMTFAGGMPPEPVFDVTAGYRTPAYRITVHFTGSPQKPTLTFSSDPPLEQADILSVILFGKPARDLGRGQSLTLQQQALKLATGYVVPQLRDSVMNVLGLDTLDVALPEGTEAPGQVRVGRYVSQDIFVSLAQEFGSRVAQVVGIEYVVGANVSVRASTSTRGDSAVDLIWQRRY